MAAPLLLDMVLETATNPGTASFVLNGAVQDRRSFASAAPSGGQVFYFADDGTQAEWGVGTLTVGTPNMLSRQSIAGTTQNTTQALNFTGTVRVYSWLPSAYTPRLDGNGLLGVSGLQADTLTVGKSAIVPAVSDWTTYQAVGAKDADVRYIKNKAAVGSGTGITGALIDGPTDAPSFLDSSGTWHVVQPHGDYATNSALNAETSRAEAAEVYANNNANSRVSKSGDTITGDLFNSGGYSINYGTAGTDNNGVWFNGFSTRPSLTSTALSSFVHRSRPGQYDYLTLQLMDSGGGWHQLEYRPDDRLYTASGNVFALTSDLPLPTYRRIEEFIVTAADGDRVNFPNGFSDSSNINIVITGQRCTSSPVVAAWENVDAGGFTIGAQREDYKGASTDGSPWQFFIQAIGNR